MVAGLEVFVVPSYRNVEEFLDRLAVQRMINARHGQPKHSSPKGWPCTRESFSEFNRQSRNFQHSPFLLYSWDVTARQRLILQRLFPKSRVKGKGMLYTGLESSVREWKIVSPLIHPPINVIEKLCRRMNNGDTILTLWNLIRIKFTTNIFLFLLYFL